MTSCLDENFLKSNKIRGKIDVHITQTTLRHCDTMYYRIPVYVQNFSMDPFGIHLFIKMAISILVEHLRNKSPVTLYLDTTGGLVSPCGGKIPNQQKNMLYYSLMLQGGGRDAPPFPISQMLSNEHSVPPITFWLMIHSIHYIYQDTVYTNPPS